jgi:acetyltransferase-like isoleucine patch superfamily enzyme
METSTGASTRAEAEQISRSLFAGFFKFVERLREGVPLSAFWRGLRLRRHFQANGLILALPGGPLPKVLNRGGAIHVESCSFEPGVRVEVYRNATLTVGKGTYMNRNVHIVVATRIAIGRRVKIGWDVVIMDTDLHGHSGQPTMTRPIVIEDDVWIGCRALILKGVHLGRGSVIGAGAIVTKNVPAGTVVASPNARIVGWADRTGPMLHQALASRLRTDPGQRRQRTGSYRTLGGD